MRHDLHVEGHGYRLRPVELSDAAAIVRLRAAAGVFLNAGAASEAAQAAWTERYFHQAGDYYFAIETIGPRRVDGYIGLYGVEATERSGQWGRWVLNDGSNAAIESALLIYRCAFDVLGLDRVYCRTLAANVKVVSFHDRCGLERTSGMVSVDHHGTSCAAVEHVLLKHAWPSVFARLDPLASRIAARLPRADAGKAQ